MTHFIRFVLAIASLAACRATLPALSPAQIYQRVADSAVIVRTKAGTTASGTVVRAGARGVLVLTAFHVVESAVASGVAIGIVAEDETGASGDVPARVVSSDPTHDLALLAAETDLDIPALPVARAEPGLYEDLFVVAAPMGLGGIASPAVLSAKEPQGAELWAITSFVFFGSSGGTVANARAELVAVPTVIPTWKSWLVTQLAFCVPLRTIREFLVTAEREAGL